MNNRLNLKEELISIPEKDYLNEHEIYAKNYYLKKGYVDLDIILEYFIWVHNYGEKIAKQYNDAKKLLKLKKLIGTDEYIRTVDLITDDEFIDETGYYCSGWPDLFMFDKKNKKIIFIEIKKIYRYKRNEIETTVRERIADNQKVLFNKIIKKGFNLLICRVESENKKSKSHPIKD